MNESTLSARPQHFPPKGKKDFEKMKLVRLTETKLLSLLTMDCTGSSVYLLNSATSLAPYSAQRT